MPILIALCFIFSLCISPTVQAASNEELLLTLAKRARESQSDAVLIIRNGRAIFEYRSDPYWQPIEAMSLTKSVVALVIGQLIDEGKIAGIDTPVYEFYPEWDQGNKRAITIRHLLTHTSGLQADDLDEVHQAPDAIQLALCAELSSYPGLHFQYNNKAVNLLSGIVEKASGQCLSEYTRQKLFRPLEIENASWLCDQAHHDYAMAHLVMTAPDLAKIGDLVAKLGMWNGQRIVSEAWIKQMVDKGQGFNPFSAHLWWMDYYSVQCYWDEPLLKQYESGGVASEYIKRLRALQGQVIEINDRVKFPLLDLSVNNTVLKCLGGQKQAEDFFKQVKAKQLPTTCWMVSGVKMIAGHGRGGQQLLIYPTKGIVAVRQTRSLTGDKFDDFPYLVEQLIYTQGN